MYLFFSNKLCENVQYTLAYKPMLKLKNFFYQFRGSDYMRINLISHKRIDMMPLLTSLNITDITIH